ncbi:hypothetical protein [Mangrovimonas cancribranchiae]|uniref:Uncharacterized protein n=1 Tax=Mangrovimonas cancribranchiae TaxID=3080055 RepID=A0AAU6P3H7_9FLAO
MKTNHKKTTTTKTTMTRKEALKKMGNYGKYAALTAIGTYVLLNPKQAQAASPEAPGDGFRDGLFD